MVLLGIEVDDIQADADWLCSKLVKLRIFNDEQDKMNLSVEDIGGELLIISQFTLYGSTPKGNRPSFIRAARPEQAVPLYEYFLKTVENALGKSPGSGSFGADMKVALVNDGPVTLIIDSKRRDF